MTNLIFKIFISAFLLISFFGCKTEKPNSAPVEVEIYFRYLEQSKTARAEATFFERKSKPEPVQFDNVLFVNHPMKAREISATQVRYFSELENREFQNLFPVKFYNKGESPREIVLKPSSVNDFSFRKPDGSAAEFLDKKEAAILSINTPVFSGKEKITLLFTNEKNESASLKIALPDKSGKTIISAKKLASLPVGNCKAELIVTKVELVEKSGAKATVISEFYSKAVEVKVN